MAEAVQGSVSIARPIGRGPSQKSPAKTRLPYAAPSVTKLNIRGEEPTQALQDLGVFDPIGSVRRDVFNSSLELTANQLSESGKVSPERFHTTDKIEAASIHSAKERTGIEVADER